MAITGATAGRALAWITYGRTLAGGAMVGSRNAAIAQVTF